MKISLFLTNFFFRLDGLKDDFDSTDRMFADLEKEVDVLRKELYKDHEPILKELPSIDLNNEDQTTERFAIVTSCFKSKQSNLLQ